jgi:glycosyltransferase involved in cell wall biosynthesis
MRLGLITTSFPRAPDDPAGAFVGEHARWLAQAGHTVEVLAAGAPTPADRAWEHEGVRVTRVRAGAELFYDEGAPDRLDRSRRAWLAAARFASALAVETRRRATRWDGAVAHWLAPGALAAALAGLGGRRPCLAVAHSGDVHLLRRLRLCAPTAALFAQRGVRLIFVSQSLRDAFFAAAGPHLAASLAARSTVVSMGVHTARFARRAAASGAAVRDVAEQPTVLFVGRLVPVKGAAHLIEAVARLRARRTDAPCLCLAGAGPDEAMLRKQAAQRGVPAAFLGEVRGAARDRALARADVVALPSVTVAGGRSEGTPLVLLEAMAAGVPVVASRVGGLAELSTSSAAAVAQWVPPADSDALAAAIERLLDHPELRARQVAAARAWVAASDWSIVGPRLLAALAAPETGSA